VYLPSHDFKLFLTECLYGMFSFTLFLYFSISIIVIYSTIYLMFIESCIYWSSTVIYWGVCFLFNMRIRKKRKKSRDTIEYLDYLSKKIHFPFSFLFFFFFSSWFSLFFILRILVTTYSSVSWNLFRITHGRAGGPHSHGFG
jgi:hypothetical protein